MSILNRFSRLLQADIHAVLDSIEEPEALLKQSMREMEEELAILSQRQKLLGQDVRRIQKRDKELSKSIDVLNDELQLCLQSDNDVLAKDVIKRRLFNERLKSVLGKKLDELTHQQSEVDAQHGSYLQQLEAIKQKADAFLADNAKGFSEQGFDYYGDSEVGCFVSDNDVEVALLKEKQLRDVGGAGDA